MPRIRIHSRCLVVPVVLAGLFAAGTAGAAGPVVQGIRHSVTPERTRIVLDLSKGASFEVRRVERPDRLAINLRRGTFAELGAIEVGNGPVRRIRRNAGRDRAQVVLDLSGAGDFRSFSLPAADGRAARVVVDIWPAVPPAAATVSLPSAARPFIVVLDAGHGGRDPGAVRGGMREKDVVLDVTLEAARLLDALPGYRAVLTRSTDIDPGLARRVAIAAAAEGDAFISVHCNTHRRQTVSGMEVYFLSLQGATDREAQELADQENAAQLVGLDPATSHDQAVVGILMDLRMSRVLHESSRLADHLLAAADASDLVGARSVKQARFRVLSSLAMPSALVELAYLSNAADRERLRDPAERRMLAALLVESVVAWRHDRDAGLRLAEVREGAWSRSYRVRRGDSLWNLARLHGTTVAEITRRNHLDLAGLNVGQVLHLPPTERMP